MSCDQPRVSCVVQWSCEICIPDHSTTLHALMHVSTAFRSAQVKVLALTDHDTMAGVPEAMEAAKQYPIRIIPGVEISAVHSSR